LRHTGQFDQTLSPLRYGGGALAVRLALAVPRGAFQYDADVEVAGGVLSADIGSGDSPSMGGAAGMVHLGAVRRLARSIAGFSLAPGLRIAGRAAAREHRFTRSQSYGRYEGSTASSYDEVVALQPQLLSTRTLRGGGTVSFGIAASAISFSAHPYFPKSLGSGTAWTGGGPAAVLLADGSLGFTRSSAGRIALGARYSVHVLRLRGTSAVAEVSHQLAATVAVRRSAR
jgi:hypothetical protein